MSILQFGEQNSAVVFQQLDQGLQDLIPLDAPSLECEYLHVDHFERPIDFQEGISTEMD